MNRALRVRQLDVVSILVLHNAVAECVAEDSTAKMRSTVAFATTATDLTVDLTVQIADRSAYVVGVYEHDH